MFVWEGMRELVRREPIYAPKKAQLKPRLQSERANDGLETYREAWSDVLDIARPVRGQRD